MRIKKYPGAREKAEPVESQNKEGNSVVPLGLPDNPAESDRWRLGACPRCRGDVFLDSEDGQLLGHCLQCGYVGARFLASSTVMGR